MFPDRTSQPAALVATATGLVAVGGREFREFLDADTPAGGTAGAWRSTDGQAWEAASPDGLAVGDAVASSGPEAGLLDVASGPAGLVAVGYAYGDPAGDTVLGGVWHSSDGRSWTRSSAPLWDLARPAAVAWSGTRYVVVGVVEEAERPRAAAWSSPDGMAWTRAADDPVFDVGTYIDTLEYRAWGGPKDLTVASDGVLLALGRTCREGRTQGASVCHDLVWRSEDGMAWTREDVGAASAGAVLLSIAAVGGTVVAVGEVPSATTVPGEGPARVVVSMPSGWKRVDPRGVPGFSRVVRFGSGLLATSGTRLWLSATGETWTEALGTPTLNVRAFDLTQVGDHVVGVGWTESERAEDGLAGGFALLGVPATP